MPHCSNLFFGKRLGVLVMAGRFEGLSDLEWKLFEDIFPKQASKRGRPRKRIKVLAADKGYDSKQKRADLRKRGIRPQIPRASLENQEK